MKNYVIAPALAALAMFVFGAIFWMSPLPYLALTPSNGDRAAAAALSSVFSTTGTYVVPGPHLDHDTLSSLYKTGPSAIVQFVREGHDEMEPAVFVKGYLHYFVVALLLNLLLQKSAASFKRYSCSVKFSAMVGLVGGVLLTGSDPIWWHHAWGWHLMGLLYGVLAFVVAGLVLGKFVQPGNPPAS